MSYRTVLWLCAANLVAGEAITGPALVTDGDTLEINGEDIRLHGIDVLESV